MTFFESNKIFCKKYICLKCFYYTYAFFLDIGQERRRIQNYVFR